MPNGGSEASSYTTPAPGADARGASGSAAVAGAGDAVGRGRASDGAWGRTSDGAAGDTSWRYWSSGSDDQWYNPWGKSGYYSSNGGKDDNDVPSWDGDVKKVSLNTFRKVDLWEEATKNGTRKTRTQTPV